MVKQLRNKLTTSLKMVVALQEARDRELLAAEQANGSPQAQSRQLGFPFVAHKGSPRSPSPQSMPPPQTYFDRLLNVYENVMGVIKVPRTF